MKNLIPFLFLALSQLAFAGSFQEILSCDQGSASVQVDREERRNLRLVIRHQGVKNYLVGEIIRVRSNSFGPEYQGYPGDFFDQVLSGTHPIKGDMVINGMAENGVFESYEFSRFESGRAVFNEELGGCDLDCPGTQKSRVPSVWVKRSGDGLLVEFWRPRNLLASCQETDPYTLRCVHYSQPVGWEALQLANWYFRRCELR